MLHLILKQLQKSHTLHSKTIQKTMKVTGGGSKSVAAAKGKRSNYQGLRYILVLDFEATCGPSVPKTEQEIIEFPIVVVDTQERIIIDTFHTYVRPTLHSTLDPFCTELTGITQAQVNASSTIDIILPQAASFVEPYLSGRSTIGKGSLMTCGDWDLLTLLPSQAAREGLDIPRFFQSWINLKDDYAEFYKKDRQKSFANMMQGLGLEIEGRHHSGLDDSRNIARIVMRMLEDGHFFKAPRKST